MPLYRFQQAPRPLRRAGVRRDNIAYDLVYDPGVSGGTVLDSQLYLKSINYTQSNGAPGAYTVTFLPASVVATTVQATQVIAARDCVDAQSYEPRPASQVMGALAGLSLAVGVDSSLPEHKRG